MPHVFSVEIAETVSRAARFGHGGRGYAGSTRWAGFATGKMPDLLTQSAAETVVIARIEVPEGVEAAAAIGAVAGIDALFVGPADLTVSSGQTELLNPHTTAAFDTVGAACRRNGKGYASWISSAEDGAALREHGVHVFFTGSEHSWILKGARVAGAALHALEGG